MSRAIREDASADGTDLTLRQSLLDVASDIVANGGPQNPIEEGWVSSADAAGISEIEIKAAASSKQPILKGLEHLIPVDNF